MILSRSSVVGIDLGNDKTVVCMARNQKLEVISNSEGSRKSATAVSFKRQQRYLGDAAMVEISSNPKNTLQFFQRFIGRDYDEEELKDELSHVGYAIEKLADGSTGIAVDYCGEKQTISPVQVVGMLLLDLKVRIEGTMNGQSFEDCVIACPSYWGNKERQLVISSAKMAGLNVIRLMNDTTAVAANYGMLRPLPKEAVHVMFVDVGVCSTKVSIARLVEGEVRIVSCSAAPDCGGREFDKVIYGILIDQLQQKFKIDISSNEKAQVKVRRQCERIKKILSANRSSDWGIESFVDGKDVNGTVDRATFEAACATLLEQLTKPIQTALDGAKKTGADLLSVEVVGGASRIPCVQAHLKSILGKDCSFTCDIYESVAKGCALQCAILSPSMKTKQFDVVDVIPYSVKLNWEKAPGGGDNVATSEMESAVVFKEFSKINTVKEIAFKGYVQPFDLVCEYDNVEKHAGVLNSCYIKDCTIGRYRTEGMESYQKDGEVHAIKVRVKVNGHGIVSCSSAGLLKKETVEEEVKEEKKEVKEEKKEENKEEKKDETKPEGAEEAASAETAEKEEKPAEDDSNKKQKVEDPKTKTKVVTKRVELTVKALRGGTIPDTIIAEFKAAEDKMQENDATINNCINTKNELEAYVLDVRGELDYSLKPFLMPSEGDTLSDTLRDVEDWLFDQDEDELGWKEAHKLFTAKLAEVRKLGDPIKQRKMQKQGREDACTRFREKVAQFKAQSSTPIIVEVPEEKKEEEPKEAEDKAEETPAEPAAEETAKCAVCGKTAADTGKNLMKCTKCQKIDIIVRYCSRECQREAWKTHKVVCGKVPAQAASAIAAATKKEENKTKLSIEALKELAKTAPEDEAKRQEFVAAVATAEKWLAELTTAQAAIPINEPQALSAQMVEEKVSELGAKFTILLAAMAKYSGSVKAEAAEKTEETKEPEEMLSLL